MRRDETSGQSIDYLHIQVELPGAEGEKKLYPPKADFTITEWWLSILKHAHNYTEKDIDHFYHNTNAMPLIIYEALSRLDLN